MMKVNTKTTRKHRVRHKSPTYGKYEVVNEQTNQAIMEGLQCLVGVKKAPVAHTVEDAMAILNHHAQ